MDEAQRATRHDEFRWLLTSCLALITGVGTLLTGFTSLAIAIGVLAVVPPLGRWLWRPRLRPLCGATLVALSIGATAALVFAALPHSRPSIVVAAGAIYLCGAAFLGFGGDNG